MLWKWLFKNADNHIQHSKNDNIHLRCWGNFPWWLYPINWNRSSYMSNCLPWGSIEDLYQWHHGRYWRERQISTFLQMSNLGRRHTVLSSSTRRKVLHSRLEIDCLHSHPFFLKFDPCNVCSTKSNGKLIQFPNKTSVLVLQKRIQLLCWFYAFFFIF